MIIDCISDLHGHYPDLSGGDMLIIGGDLTARDTEDQNKKCFDWMYQQEYRKIVFIGGNHDNLVQKDTTFYRRSNANLIIETDPKIEYLCDSMTTFEGLKIWGTPWTPWFYGVNPHCKAFMVNESKLAEKFALIPDKIDILVSHGPPKGCLDGVADWNMGKIEHVGSQSLKEAVERVQPLYHVFGHIHEHGGKRMTYKWMMDKRADCKMYNCSVVDEHYKPNNQVRRIILKDRWDKLPDVEES